MFLIINYGLIVLIVFIYSLKNQLNNKIMPQLDIMTFFSQFFWFSFGFFIFYTLILHYILPLIFISLNFRKKKIRQFIKTS